jgi:acetyl esterase/lipase
MSDILEAIARQSTVALWPANARGIDVNQPEEQTAPAQYRHIYNPTLTIYEPPPAERSGSAVIVCPGGSYGMVSCVNEGDPIARWLNALGICAYVLKYRLPATEGADFHHPVPLADAQRAIRIIRGSATERGLNPDRIGIMGFSAGGHLAASAATMFDEPVAEEPISCRPDAVLLIYPVITFVNDAYCHAGSRKNLLGPIDCPSLREHLSPELRITSQTPPTFLAHARDDGGVPYQNSELFHNALTAKAVPSSLNLYHKGGHGFGLGSPEHDSSQWPTAAATWLEQTL